LRKPADTLQEDQSTMRMKPTGDARRGRRVRTRVTRVLVLALAGPLMVGSIAYAAGVGPVRRRVDDFLKGTAGFFSKAESGRDFHLSPNPSGQGVLVVPVDDRGPRAASGTVRSTPGSERTKPESGSASHDRKKPRPKEDHSTRDAHTGSNASKEEKSETSSKPAATVHSEPGSGEGVHEMSEQDSDSSEHVDSGGATKESDDGSGPSSHSGSGGSHVVDSNESSGEGSDSEKS
jgi:hypothetical protein